MLATSRSRTLRLLPLLVALPACDAEPRGPQLLPPSVAVAPLRGGAITAPVGTVVPRFEDFPADEMPSIARPAEVDLASHPDAREFRTVLRRGAARGPNFAGAYTVVTWECGTLCQQIRIVDARTGRVHEGPVAALGVRFRRDSRLLVVNPPERVRQNPCPHCPTLYYIWSGAGLHSLPDPGAERKRLRTRLDSLHTAEAQRLRGHAPFVVRSPADRLVITARNGRQVVLQDEFSGHAPQSLHLFRGYHRAAGSYLVEIRHSPEGGSFLLVHALTGRSLEVDAEPLASPDGRRFVTASADVVAGHRPNRLRVYRAEPDGPVLEHEVEPASLPTPRDWGADSPVWLDDRTILFQRVEVDFSTAPLTFRQRPQRLELTPGGWRLRPP